MPGSSAEAPSGGSRTVGCRPRRGCNGSLTRLTALITSAFVPGLFLRRIVGPSAIFILPHLSRSYDRCVARSNRVETITPSPRYPSIDARPRATIRPTPATRRVKPSNSLRLFRLAEESDACAVTLPLEA